MQIDNAELTDWFLFNFSGIDIIDYNKQNQQQKLFADLTAWGDNTSYIKTRMSADETHDKQDYSLFQNNAGELMLMIGSFHTPHDNSRLLYDGGDHMLLYHDSKNSLLLKDISSEASKALTTMKKILVVETQDNDVMNEYTVPIHLIKDVDPLIVK